MKHRVFVIVLAAAVLAVGPLIRRLGMPKTMPTRAAITPESRKTATMLSHGKAVESLKAE